MASLRVFVFIGALAAMLLSFVSTVDASGGGCLGCTLAASLIFRMAKDRNNNVLAATNDICSSIVTFDKTIEGICQFALGILADKLQKDYNDGASPDVVCKTTVQICPIDTKCKLYKQWPLLEDIKKTPVDVTSLPMSPFLELVANSSDEYFSEPSYQALLTELFDFVSMGLGNKKRSLDVSKLSNVFQTYFESSSLDFSLKSAMLGAFPKTDADGDGSSPNFDTGRGAHWKGRDCDDTRSDIYPGRKIHDDNHDVDHNCNGIYGVDPKSNLPWEKILCSNTQQYGFMALGDSATAHFAIPGEFITPSEVKPSTYVKAFELINNEGDWPQCSGYTGFASGDDCMKNGGEQFSIYNAMRERNLCMHRDYANYGVNGNRITDQPTDNIYISRNPQHDHPVIATLNMIGNDVCNSEATIESMTTTQQYIAGAVKALAGLDKKLPPGSHVFISGLVDGSVLYDILHDRMHPAGVTYAEVYDYLNCHQTSPCSGWMNSDVNIRKRTSDHARMLTNLNPTVINMISPQLVNIQVHTIPLADHLKDVIAEWIAEGKDPAMIIEALDGFHPSTTGQSLLGKRIFKDILKVVSIPINPTNNLIKQKFGQQGGY